jgi:hypothetical protein
MASKGQGFQNIYPDALTSNSTTALNQLGALRYEYDGTNGMKVYKYVLAGGTIANGTVCSAYGTAGTQVWSSTTNTPGKIPATGIGVGAITSGSYGWVLVDGYHSAIMKPTTSATTALKVMYHLCGKMIACTTDATSTLMSFVDNVIALSTKASACTTFPGIVHLM